MELFWAFYPEFSWKKGLCQFFNICIIYHCAKKSEGANEPFLRKLLDGHTKNQFILLILSWDAANFRDLRLIEKSHNLIGHEHFGPYVRNHNFSKKKFV